MSAIDFDMDSTRKSDPKGDDPHPGSLRSPTPHKGEGETSARLAG
jgi:hypothetical protein